MELKRILEEIDRIDRERGTVEASGVCFDLRNAVNAMEADMPEPLTYQVTPETISAVKDALEYHLGPELLNRIEETPHQLAAILLQQAVCASVPEPADE